MNGPSPAERPDLTPATAMDMTASLIDGFESPYGMEVLATVDWLLSKEQVAPNVTAVREGLQHWPAGAAERKSKLFDDRSIGIALERLQSSPVFGHT